MLAWSIAFGALVLSEGGAARIPAYHDGRLHFEVAWALREHLYFPFVATLDTGHPPLISWILALSWALPFPRLVVMHFVVWAAAATLVAAVFEVARRSFGAGAGLFAAGLLFVHPVFAAQALQLNLDLFHAAFAWLTVLGVTSGRPRMVAFGATAAALTKLNGLFTTAGLLVWVVLALALSRDLRPRKIAGAFAPPCAAIAVFGLYHAVKLAAVGHLFATREFEDDNLRFVDGLPAWSRRVSHAVEQITGYHNPNLWVVRAIIVGGAIALVAMAAGLRSRPTWFSSSERSATAEFYRPLSPAATLGLVAVIASVHVALWSLRSYPSLVRYFLLVYPALYLALAAIVTLLATLVPAAARRVFLIALGAPLALLFTLQARPTTLARWFPERAGTLLFPPSNVPTNYENSLELLDLMAVLAKTADYVERAAPAGNQIRARWPFEAYLTDPRHDVVRTPRSFSPEAPDLVVETSVDRPRSKIRSLKPPTGFELTHVESSGRVWMAVFEKSPTNATDAAR